MIIYLAKKKEIHWDDDHIPQGERTKKKKNQMKKI
jgi:hypothetical protein